MEKTHSNRASIAIFKNLHSYDEDTGQPIVPAEVFEAAKKVIENQGSEIIKARDGLYIVKYSPTGPFESNEGVRFYNDQWLPVYIARIESWSSGGIRQSEMDQYNGVVRTFSAPEPKIINGDQIS